MGQVKNYDLDEVIENIYKELSPNPKFIYTLYGMKNNDLKKVIEYNTQEEKDKLFKDTMFSEYHVLLEYNASDNTFTINTKGAILEEWPDFSYHFNMYIKKDGVFIKYKNFDFINEVSAIMDTLDDSVDIVLIYDTVEMNSYILSRIKH